MDDHSSSTSGSLPAPLPAEDLLQEVLHKTPGAIIITDTDGQVLTWNPEAEKLFGWTAGEIVQSRLPLFPPSAPVSDLLKNILTKGGTARGYTCEARHKNNSVLFVRLAASALHGENESVAGAVLLVADVTDLVRAERGLRNSEARYRTLVDVSPDPIFIHESGDFTFANRATAKLLGVRSPDDLVGRSVFSFIHPEYHASVRHRIQRMETTGEAAPFFELAFVSSEGELKWVDVSARPFSNERGTPIHVVAHDLTERKKAEQERIMLAHAVAQSSDPIVITNPEHKTVYVNPAFERASGFTRNEILGKDALEFACAAEPRGGTSTQQTGPGRYTGTLIFRSKEGASFEAEGSITPIRDQVGALQNYVIVSRDVTRERLLERQFLHAQKMEAVGRLAGGIAHDFNNLLMVINACSEMLLDPGLTPESARESVEDIRRAVERATSLTQHLLLFSRKQVEQPTVVDLNKIIRQAETILRDVIGENITLVTELGGDIGTIKTDPAILLHVLMNLALHARDAMPTGGRLRIQTANAQLSRAVDPGGDSEQDDHVLLSFSDTGQAIAPDALPFIFEPFFATQQPEGRSGLGLAMVYAVVKQNGGFIRVDSQPEKGTRFDIFFPRSLDTGPAGALAGPATSARRGFVLIVEDENVLRRVLRDALVPFGYSVVDAEDGISALALQRQDLERIDVLVTDLVMPGMSGHELARKLVEINPNLKIIYMSGYTDDAGARTAIGTSNVTFLQKPFRTSHLIKKVGELLAKHTE